MQWTVYTVDRDGVPSSTVDRVVELVGNESSQNILKVVFSAYGFTNSGYHGPFGCEQETDQIKITYNYVNEGRKLTWLLRKLK